MMSSNVAAYKAAFDSLNSGSKAGAGADKSADKAGAAALSAAGSQTTDTVHLSAAAKSIAAQTAGSSAKKGYYEQLMPTRAGFSSANLALGITKPGAEPFSKGKTLAQVADAARAELDKQYSAMGVSGQPFDPNSPDGQDGYSLMGNLDRRALLAIANNQGGKFSKQEQQIATSIMQQQQSLASGQFSGPSSMQDSWVDIYANDPAARQQASLHWLDQVSDDEKKTMGWVSARAQVQAGATPQAPGAGNFHAV